MLWLIQTMWSADSRINKHGNIAEEGLGRSRMLQAEMIIIDYGGDSKGKKTWRYLAVIFCSRVVSENCAGEMNQQPILLNPNNLAIFSLSSANLQEAEVKSHAFGLQRRLHHCSWLLLVKFMVRILSKKHIKMWTREVRQKVALCMFLQEQTRQRETRCLWVIKSRKSLVGAGRTLPSEGSSVYTMNPFEGFS